MNNFINEALIFIGATVLIVPLFKLLGFGSVLGYLVAGAIVGPYGFKLIHEAESVMHLSELGVVLLLFIIGLEIQPSRLWNMRRHLMGLGGLQVSITTVIFTLIGVWYGLAPVPSLILAFALSLSSTAFALQYLVEKNLFNTTFGQSSFAILLSQDLVAIPILAIIPAIVAQTESNQETLSPIVLIYFTIMIIFLMLASKYLIRPLFRVIASTRAQELFTATTLLIVLGVASITLKIGLSAALGTFIAGVLLANSEYRHELEANLEPFKSLLMGLFFISVGMSVSLPLILSKPLLIAGFSFAYILIKLLIIYGVGRLFNLSHDSSKLMSLAVGQGGEFAFVIFGITLSLGVVPSEILGVLTAVITVSMALSPVLNLLNEKFDSLSKKPGPQYDVIKDDHAEIIIAGFGRFGQIFGRILKSQNIPFVAIDHDADQVNTVRKYGNKVYFGDASRKEILEMAGIEKTKYFILAIDNVEQSLSAAKTISMHYPHVKIFARARNRGHVFEFMELGLKHIKRESFDSSLSFVGELLQEMKFAPDRVQLMLERFKEHDENLIKEQFKVRKDEEMFIGLSNQGQEQLKQVMGQESNQSFIDIGDSNSK